SLRIDNPKNTISRFESVNPHAEPSPQAVLAKFLVLNLCPEEGKRAIIAENRCFGEFDLFIKLASDTPLSSRLTPHSGLNFLRWNFVCMQHKLEIRFKAVRLCVSN